jgi:hypothetical protein
MKSLVTRAREAEHKAAIKSRRAHIAERHTNWPTEATDFDCTRCGVALDNASLRHLGYWQRNLGENAGISLKGGPTDITLCPACSVQVSDFARTRSVTNGVRP